MGSFKLNTNGSFQQGLAACGGLIRNACRQFIAGFHCNLGATSVLAELWGLTLGLRLARILGLKSLLVELDSKVVVTMMKMRRTHCARMQPFLDEALELLYAPDWFCTINHIYREANSCADILAGVLGHTGSFQWTMLDHAPSALNLALEADARGCGWFRLVSSV